MQTKNLCYINLGMSCQVQLHVKVSDSSNVQSLGHGDNDPILGIGMLTRPIQNSRMHKLFITN